MKQIGQLLFGLCLFSACTDNEKRADAYGNFEAVETIVSAQATGSITSFSVAEGQLLKAGQAVGQIDTEALTLRRAQLVASKRAVASRAPNVTAQLSYFSDQIAVQEQQRKNLNRERIRTQHLLADGAATPKQLDDIEAQLAVIDRQIALTHQQRAAQASALTTQRTGIRADAAPLDEQVKQIDDQIRKSTILNPLTGTVTVKFAQPGEVTSYGKALYKIADLEIVTLRAYVAGDQLVNVKVGQSVTVQVDAPNNTMKPYTGTITFISDKAEFTPKMIQTKDERVNLVYAMKIAVKNDGSLKIGMPGEVLFGATTN